jgi:hypothetical protein
MGFAGGIWAIKSMSAWCEEARRAFEDISYSGKSFATPRKNEGALPPFSKISGIIRLAGILPQSLNVKGLKCKFF